MATSNLVIGPQRAVRRDKPSSVKFNVTRVQIGSEDFDCKEVNFRRDGVIFLDGRPRPPILANRIIKIFVNEAKGSILVVESPLDSKLFCPATLYKFFTESSVSILLDMYPNEITSTAEYDSLLENELPKEHWNSYHLKSKTTSNLGLNDYANLDCGGWFNDVMIMSYLDRVLKGQKDLGDAKVHIIETGVINTINSKTPYGALKMKVGNYCKREKLFDNDLIVFPLNVTNEHWLLLIVCYPDLDRPYDIDTGEPCDALASTKEICRKHLNGLTSVIDLELQSGLQYIRKLQLRHQSRLMENVLDRAVRIKQPCFLVFDSAKGYIDKVLDLIVNVKRFLICRQSMEGRSAVKFKDIIVHFPKVPKQLNKSDCGLFTVHYFYEFMEFFKSNKFSLAMPIEMDLSTIHERMWRSREYLAIHFKKENPLQKDLMPIVSSAGFFKKNPDRDDDGLPKDI